MLERIKKDEQLRKIPVVILTTSDAERDRARAYKQSCQQLRGQTDRFRAVSEHDQGPWILLGDLELPAAIERA